MSGTQDLHEIEQQIELAHGDEKVVLVEVGKVEQLIESYPNYFGDVSLFIRNLKLVCEGKSAIEYSMAQQERVPLKPRETPDPSLLRRRYTRWTEGPWNRPK